MRKWIASTLMAVALTGAIVLLLSSCTYWFDRSAQTDYGAFADNVVYKPILTSPVDAEAHYLMGCQFQKRQKHAWAIEEFQAAVRQNPTYVEAYNRLGVSYDLTGEYEKAQAAYAAALGLDPDLDYVQNNLGYSYLLQNRFDLAVASFRKAVALNGQNQRYRNNLAMAYAKGGQEEAAVASFKTGGDEAQAHLSMAKVFYRDGEYEKAEAYFARANRLKPRDDQTAKGLAAAASLAEIHARRMTAEQAREETVSKSEQATPNRFDAEGFYTVPAVPVEDFDNRGIVVVSITESDRTAEAEIEEPVYFIASVTPAETPAVTKEIARETRAIDARLLLEETEVRGLLAVDPGDAAPGSAKRVRIEVANGNGVRHMAKQVGHFLKDQTLILMYLSNADHFDYDRTSIFYTSENLGEALRVAEKLPGRQQMQELTAIRNGHADISVRIGKDLLPHLDMLTNSPIGPTS